MARSSTAGLVSVMLLLLAVSVNAWTAPTTKPTVAPTVKPTVAPTKKPCSDPKPGQHYQCKDGSNGFTCPADCDCLPTDKKYQQECYKPYQKVLAIDAANVVQDNKCKVNIGIQCTDATCSADLSNAYGSEHSDFDKAATTTVTFPQYQFVGSSGNTVSCNYITTSIDCSQSSGTTLCSVVSNVAGGNQFSTSVNCASGTDCDGSILYTGA